MFIGVINLSSIINNPLTNYENEGDGEDSYTSITGMFMFIGVINLSSIINNPLTNYENEGDGEESNSS